MTKKLYDSDGYQIEFDAKVIESRKVENHYEVELDQSAFFPEEGGQRGDQGFLDEEVVRDVQIRENIIYHILNHPIEVGSQVHGKVNWEDRYYNMQHHTGEHIFSGLVHQQYGYENVGFHLSPNIVTIDVSGELSETQLEKLEREVNDKIYEQIPVKAFYPSEAKLEQLMYRSKKELSGPIRIVEIDGCDRCACCAPHVLNTGEVGSFHIVNYMKYKHGTRIEIRCGMKAVEGYHKLQKQVNRLGRQLSVKPTELEKGINQLKKELEEVREECRLARERCYQYEVEKLPAAIEHRYLFFDKLDKGSQRKLVNAMIERASGACGVFVGSDDTNYRYIIGSPVGDAKTINEDLCHVLGAEGGGSSQMVQGTIHALNTEIITLFNKK